MTEFYDMRVNSTLSIGESTPSEIGKFVEGLGIHGVCFADFARRPISDFNKLKDELGDFKIKILSRADITAKSSVSLKRALSRIRGNIDIIGVECPNRNLFSLAARDSRVDIIVINPENAKIFRRTAAKLAAKNNTAVEISLSWIISTRGVPRVNILNGFCKVVEETVNANAPLLLSSGATHKYQLRGPRELMALAKLLDIDEKKAKQALSEVPKRMILRNVEKRDPDYVMKGIKIVKRPVSHK
ncbi:MAG: RNase P subunit p30 family protein [Promethearchaeota archaeon]